ncbi:RNA polymerase sigma-70 factor [Parabacteroides sp. BX2]|uniref:RNA polymerase sigma-70 factor n=1 Tax=Parabacteroides segnis TaxID=2763058 RepID=A0ABR7E7G1_9BACT|nr:MULTISPECIES: RNA polymerase sigma-70 factor [Parabacteroides]MBC5645682.1 RNA polymerase sigma-70 factor [Parabacteroides segnis]MCM0712578.1 RNA polymerase sigma-70 factor [Parabacteroides sp. TA-V-105]
MKTGLVDIKDLLKMVADDNRLAFTLFYDLYYDQIFRFAYYFLKNTEACREVVTEVFFSIWQSRLKLKDIENIETYLFVTVRNETTRYQTRMSKSHFVSLDETSLRLTAREDESPEDKLLVEEMEKILNRVIDELPEKCRLIFLLARQEGLKPKEIAERLSIKESTVRVQMKIAVDKIVTNLKPYFPDITFTLLLAHIV